MSERQVEIVKSWQDDIASYEIKKLFWSVEAKAIAPSLHDYHCGYCTIGPDIIRVDERHIEENVDVHGGVTFSHPGDVRGNWTFGFDCAHVDDENNPQLQDIDWLTAECESMARQIRTLLDS